ncbi:MAG: hypothetical protein KIH63_003055 [Candidatus Saccharibacteria bacterium]|nr:hypothetical protein [Candidatus Saccharibacteria bacterium]
MRSLENIKELLTPSFASATTVIGATVVFLGGATFITSSDSGALYEWLFGETSSASQIETAKSALQTVNDTVLGNSTLNQLLFFVLWALIGLAVYVIIAGINREVSSVSEDLEDMVGKNTHTDEIRHEIITKAILRMVFIACWGIYAVFSVRIYLPFSFLCARIGGTQLSEISGWLFILAGTLTMLLSLHMHVVFARLVMLKTRLFEN